MEVFYEILLGLDAIIYTFINYMFNVFLLLARATIFNEGTIAPLIRRIYIIIGVVMLFLLSYSLLKSIVMPAGGKDKDSAGKMIFNVVKAVVLLALVPTIFSFAFKIQDAILKQNTIGKIILGTDQNNGNSNLIANGGMEMAYGVFEAFLFPTNDDIPENEIMMTDSVSYAEFKGHIKTSSNFFYLDNAANLVEKGKLTYYWGVSSVAGLVVLYMLLSYCLSLGFRVIKLAFYEIMAPISIIASILPSKKDMLNKWIKATLQTFIEVFLRIAILYFAIYLIQAINNAFAEGLIKNVGGVGEKLAKCIIIMGIVTFVKKAPELIADITGMDSKNMGLGIKDQLAAGGFFTAGAIAGGALTAGARNFFGNVAPKFTEAHQNFRATKGTGVKNRFKAFGTSSKIALGGIASGFGRGIAGATSGGLHAFNGGSKDIKGMRESARKGATIAGERAVKRASYKASHGGTLGAMKGHVVDAGRSFGDYIGINSIDNLVAENKVLDEIASAQKSIKTNAFSLIDGEADKASSSFRIGGYTATKLREYKLQMEGSEGTDDYEDMRKRYDTYRFKFSQAVQDVALLSESEYKTSVSNTGTLAKLASTRMAAEDFRNKIKSNLSNEVVSKAGYTASNMDSSWKVTVAGPTKDIGDAIDIRKAENHQKIAKYQEERKDKEEKK